LDRLLLLLLLLECRLRWLQEEIGLRRICRRKLLHLLLRISRRRLQRLTLVLLRRRLRSVRGRVCRHRPRAVGAGGVEGTERSS